MLPEKKWGQQSNYFILKITKGEDWLQVVAVTTDGYHSGANEMKRLKIIAMMGRALKIESIYCDLVHALLFYFRSGWQSMCK